MNQVLCLTKKEFDNNFEPRYTLSGKTPSVFPCVCRYKKLTGTHGYRYIEVSYDLKNLKFIDL